jgi:hypothetical protein
MLGTTSFGPVDAIGGDLAYHEVAELDAAQEALWSADAGRLHIRSIYSE